MSNLMESEREDLYREALHALSEHRVQYMLGGAFAVYYYTNWWRSTHDIDIYVLPKDRDRALEALKSADFRDMGEQAEGDKQWIYHAAKKSIIADVIWRFANLVNYVSDDWLQRAPRGRFLDMDVAFVPLEELIWIKIFVINRHRCDWPDIMRIIRSQCSVIDWNRLLDMLDQHWLLLSGLIDVFDWLYSDSMNCIPSEVREELTERRKTYRESATSSERERLLDPWIRQRADRYAIWRDESPHG